MNREERLVFLALLIPSVYALLMWLEKGLFIYPFPLNEIIFFCVSVVYLFRHYAANKLRSVLIGGFSICSLLSSEFFLQFLLDGATWESFHLSILPYISIVQLLFLSCWFIISLYPGFIEGKPGQPLLLTSIYIMAFVCSSPLLLSICFAGIGYHLKRHKALASQHVLWLLLGFLVGAKSITLLLIG